MFHRPDTAQLSFALEPPVRPRDADELLARLRELGLRRIARCSLTRNRNVMVSFRGADLRVHEGYLEAPLEVHTAIVRFIEGRTRAERRVARRRIIEFGVATPGVPDAPMRRERMRPEDEPTAERLTGRHARYNAEYFGDALKPVPVRVSRRMRSRLGHYTASKDGDGAEIAISWRHLRR